MLADAAHTYEEPARGRDLGEAHEVRRYQPYVVAEYGTGADFDRAGYEAYRPLLDRYLSELRHTPVLDRLQEQQWGREMAKAEADLRAGHLTSTLKRYATASRNPHTDRHFFRLAPARNSRETSWFSAKSSATWPAACARTDSIKSNDALI